MRNRKLIALVGMLLLLGAADKPGETNWQLANDQDFTVKIEPWPAKQGAAVKLHATVSADKDDQKFAGQVAYRIATDEKNSGSWTPMKPAKSQDATEVDFTANASMPRAPKAYVQFRVQKNGQ